MRRNAFFLLQDFDRRRKKEEERERRMAGGGLEHEATRGNATIHGDRISRDLKAGGGLRNGIPT